MTPFAQLERDEAGLEKSAVGGALRGLHKLVTGGVWRSIANKAAPKSLAGRTARLFDTGSKGTKLSAGLGAYGMGGIASEMMGGPSLPGHQLAFAAATPILGAAYAAPGIINTLRASTDRNKKRIGQDIQSGADQAISDAITLGLSNPQHIGRKGFYSDAVQQAYPGMEPIFAQYSAPGKTYNPMSSMSAWRNILGGYDQRVISNRIDKNIDQWNRMEQLFGNPEGASSEIQKLFPGMQKGASFGAIGKAFGNVLPWLGVGAAGAGIGHSILRDKPYDETDAMSRGYAAATQKIQGKLNNMTGFQKWMIQRDPTLLAREINKASPGAIKKWEAATGQSIPKGLISGMMDRFGSGKNYVPGSQDFYTYDAFGRRHYL